VCRWRADDGAGATAPNLHHNGLLAILPYELVEDACRAAVIRADNSQVYSV
jgi:hypothetical protein